MSWTHLPSQVLDANCRTSVCTVRFFPSCDLWGWKSQEDCPVLSLLSCGLLDRWSGHPLFSSWGWAALSPGIKNSALMSTSHSPLTRTHTHSTPGRQGHGKHTSSARVHQFWSESLDIWIGASKPWPYLEGCSLCGIERIEFITQASSKILQSQYKSAWNENSP